MGKQECFQDLLSFRKLSAQKPGVPSFRLLRLFYQKILPSSQMSSLATHIVTWLILICCSQAWHARPFMTTSLFYLFNFIYQFFLSPINVIFYNYIPSVQKYFASKHIMLFHTSVVVHWLSFLLFIHLKNKQQQQISLSFSEPNQKRNSPGILPDSISWVQDRNHQICFWETPALMYFYL